MTEKRTPRVVLLKFNGKVDCFDQLVPDLGFAYLTTSLKNANIRYIFYDLSLWKSSEPELMSIIEKENPIFVGMKLQNIGKGINEVITLAKRIKEKFNCRLVAGGPIVRLFEESCYNLKEFHIFDALVYGDGEEVITKLFLAFRDGGYLGDIPNLLFRERGIIKKTYWKPFDFENSGPISWDAFELKNYLPIFPINLKRGCEFGCSFCSHPYLWGRNNIEEHLEINSHKDFTRLANIRMRSWESIQEEIEQDYKKYKARIFYIVDSTPDINLLNQFTEFVIQNQLNLRWASFARFGLFNESIIRKFQKGGLSALWYGWESGDNRILKLMYKKFNIDMIKDAYSFLKNTDIFIAGSFIIGHPGETFESINETKRLIRELELQNYSISPFRLHPGSYIAFNPREYDIEIYPDWKERILKGYLMGKSELDIEYYKIKGQTNIEWWNNFKERSDYREWFDLRVRENSEIAYLLASHLGQIYLDFLNNFLKVLEKKSQQDLDGWLELFWRNKGE